MPFSTRMSAITSPSRASDGAVRKNRPSSSAVVSAGLVAEGEIITIPFGRATFCSTAPVMPEQSPPMMPRTPSAVISRSAAAVPAAVSTAQVLSARTPTTVEPFRNRPDSDASRIARSAAFAIWPVSDSIGPVKPMKMPSLTSSARAAPARAAVATVARSSFFILISLVGSQSCRAA